MPRVLDQIAPTISSSVYGPLGIMHLPRLWLKLVLHATGRLPEGYRHGIGGFDEFVITSLGIERDAFIAYVENEKPDYPAVEAWVRAHATKLDDETIAAINRRITTTDMPDELRKERFTRLNISDPAYTKAVAINDLDDWDAMHRALTG